MKALAGHDVEQKFNPWISWKSCVVWLNHSVPRRRHDNIDARNYQNANDFASLAEANATMAASRLAQWRTPCILARWQRGRQDVRTWITKRSGETAGKIEYVPISSGLSKEKKCQIQLFWLSDRDKVRRTPRYVYIKDTSELGLNYQSRAVIDTHMTNTKVTIKILKTWSMSFTQGQYVTAEDYGLISPYESKANPEQIEERLAFTRIGAGDKMRANRKANNSLFCR